MNYVIFTAGTKEYKLKLPTKSIVLLERQLGCNPLAIFGNGEQMPTVTTMVAVLHASLQQLQHGITMVDAYGIFDDYLQDGNSMTDFVQVILDIYRASGLLRDEAKN